MINYIKKRLKRRTKVTFLMRSGNTFTMRFEKFEITRLSGSPGTRKLTYTNSSNTFSVDVALIEACIIK